MSRDRFVIRRIINARAKGTVVTPICLSNPIASELKIQYYSRLYLETLDNYYSRNRRTISLPFLLFIDRFGLYRNVYRSLIGFYCILVCISFYKRARRANVFPITLRPYRSNFATIVNAIGNRGLTDLDKGVEIQIDGKRVLLVAFTFAMIRDMPQQQKNSRMKTQKANLSCRICFIYVDERRDLDFDTFSDGRYYYTVMYIRQDIARRITQKSRDDYTVLQGVDPSPDSIALQERIVLASDIIVTRLGDPVYSEYSSLSRMLYNLLIEGVLTLSAAKEYVSLLRIFPFLLSQPRIQGLLYYLKSYNLSEHVRQSYIIPILLRVQLQTKHIRKPLLIALIHVLDLVRYICS